MSDFAVGAIVVDRDRDLRRHLLQQTYILRLESVRVAARQVQNPDRPLARDERNAASHLDSVRQ